MSQDNHKDCNDKELSDDITASAPPLPASVLAAECVHRVGESLHSASEQVNRATKQMNNEATLRVAMSMVLRMPQLLPLLKEYPDLPAPDARYIPACPLCQARPGIHWAHNCPTIGKDEKIRAKYVFDYRTNTLRRYKDLEAEPDPRDYAPHLIPRCGVCGKGPGAHWPDRCPDNPIRDKMWGDRVVPPSEQEANRKEMEEFDE